MSAPTPSPARIHEFSIVENEPVAEGVFRLTIKAPALASAIRPGQFMSLAVPGDATQLVRLPFSYACANADAGTVTSYIAIVGDGTRRLSEMPVGATSTVLGPGGNGWRVPADVRRALVVAGGIGITPVIAAAGLLAERGVAADAVVGALTATKLCGLDELARAGAGEVRVTTDDGSAGTRGTVLCELAPMLATGSYDLVLCCGPEPMMRAVAAACAEARVACEVSMERMMTCGFGACATCNVETVDGGRGACTAGPVFDAGEVAW